MLNFASIPLSTERLLLRPFEMKDAPAVFRLNRDEEVLRWTAWKPLVSEQQAADWISSVLHEQYAKYGYGRLAITLRETGELIGWSGVKFAEAYGVPTLGYRLLKEHWGKGYATEAAQVSLQHAFHTIGLEKISAFIFEPNKASAHVLEKSGFVYSGLHAEAAPAEIRYTIQRPPDRSFGQQPVFETDRLAFYPITAADAGVMYALNSDPEVTQYTGDTAFRSLGEAADFLRDREAKHRRDGYARWKIVLKKNAECLGWCGLKKDDETGLTDVGYRLFRRHWGKGYATEAAKASLDYGFGVLKLNRIIAQARKENVASLRVLEKCGMKIIGEDTDCGGEIFVFETDAH